MLKRKSAHLCTSPSSIIYPSTACQPEAKVRKVLASTRTGIYHQNNAETSTFDERSSSFTSNATTLAARNNISSCSDATTALVQYPTPLSQTFSSGLSNTSSISDKRCVLDNTNNNAVAVVGYDKLNSYVYPVPSPNTTSPIPNDNSLVKHSNNNHDQDDCEMDEMDDDDDDDVDQQQQQQQQLYTEKDTFYYFPKHTIKRIMKMKERESKYLVDSTFLTNNPKKSKLSDGGVHQELLRIQEAIAEEFGYNGETLYIAVNIMNRYLSSEYTTVLNTKMTTYHHIALASIFIAAKLHEEVLEPCAEEFVTFVSELVDVTHLKAKSVKDTERRILSFMSFQVHIVTPQAILHEILDGKCIDKGHSKVIMEHCEYYFTHSLFRTEFMEYKPSVMAVASLLSVLDMEDVSLYLRWEKLVQLFLFTFQEQQDVKDCTRDIGLYLC